MVFRLMSFGLTSPRWSNERAYFYGYIQTVVGQSEADSEMETGRGQAHQTVRPKCGQGIAVSRQASKAHLWHEGSQEG